MAAGLTDTGRVREHNEDNLLIDRDLGLFAVADGMGGQLAGEIASRMALETLKYYLERCVGENPDFCPDDTGLSPEADRLVAGIRLANREIFKAGESNPAWRNMGTTIVATLIAGNRLILAHVGDSRCYLLRNETMTQLTDDHSLVAEQQRLGLITPEEAATSRMKNVITRAVGAFSEVEVDLSEHRLRPGDRVLICSDGLTNMVADAEILAVATRAAAPEQACATLINGANQRGGRDNITVILIAVEED